MSLPLATFHNSTPGKKTDHPRTSRGAWLTVLATVCGLMAMRMPGVATVIRSKVDEAIASGELEDTSQRSLAVSIGITTAIALSFLVVIVIVSLAKRFESRLRLPWITVGRRRVSGVLVVVATALVAKQVTSFILPVSGELWNVGLWGSVLAPVLVAVGLVAKQSSCVRSRRRTLTVGLAVGLLAIAV